MVRAMHLVHLQREAKREKKGMLAEFAKVNSCLRKAFIRLFNLESNRRPVESVGRAGFDSQF